MELAALVELPDAGRDLWAIFQLLRRRCAAGFGANPISLQDVAAYQTLMRRRLDRWEVETLFAMDDAMLEQLASDQAEKTEQPKPASSARRRV